MMDDNERKCPNEPVSLGDHAPHPVKGSCKRFYLQIHAVEKSIIIDFKMRATSISWSCFFSFGIILLSLAIIPSKWETIIPLFSSIAKVKVTCKVCQTAVQISRQHLKEHIKDHLSIIHYSIKVHFLPLTVMRLRSCQQAEEHHQRVPRLDLSRLFQVKG